MYAGNGGHSSLGAASAGGGGGSGGGGGGLHHHGHGHGGAALGAQAEANDLDALVFEFGTSRCKLGYAGEDFPRVYESPVGSAATGAANDDDVSRWRAAVAMEGDYECVAQWLFDAASSRLEAKLSEHPLLVVERPFALPEMTETAPTDKSSDATTTAPPPSTSTTGDPATSKSSSSNNNTSNATSTMPKKRDGKARERMLEVLMEQLDLPAVFCAKSAVLACYANARTSGLVVELGATYTSVTAVHEGYAFAYPKSQVQVYGGRDLDALLRYKLDAQLGGRATPTPTPTTGSRYYWSLAVEAKESGLCRVADGPFDEAQNAQLPKIAYELPDKTVVHLGTERFSIAEQYFTPPGASTISTTATTTTTTEQQPAPMEIVQGWEMDDTARAFGVKRGIALPELVCETGAMTTETELRKELFQNIVLTGGSSSFENLPTRLEREIVVALSSLQGGGGSSSGHVVGGPTGNGFHTAGLGNLRVKLIAAHAQERRIGSFLGGSILASLGSFHEMWMSKAEYAEHGASLIHKKCP